MYWKYWDLKLLYDDYCKLYDNPMTYTWFRYALLAKDTLERTEKDDDIDKKRKYHKRYREKNMNSILMMARINKRHIRQKPIQEAMFNRMKRYLEQYPRRWIQKLDL